MSRAADDLPPRMTTNEVCKLARYGRMKLAAKVRAGLMPEPIEVGRPNIYSRDAVLKALGLLDDQPKSNPWDMDPDAIREALSRKVRDRQAAKGRKPSRPHGGAVPPAPLRLVASNPPATR